MPEEIRFKDGNLIIPDNPIIPFIEGDGVGPDIWKVSVQIFDHAVKKGYDGNRKIEWLEIFAGDKAYKKIGEWLPVDTLDAIQRYKIAIKGPLTTPVAGGIRSLNVTFRQKLDLYACVRPVRYFKGTPSPVKKPEKLDIVIFRENTEDVYAGIEFKEGTKQAKELIKFLEINEDKKIREDSGVGIKPISIFGTKRLVKRAIQYAVERHRRRVTLVHKGNIMKYTEGAFRDWGYEVARNEFPDRTITETELMEDYKGAIPTDKVLINDRIADAMFQQLLLRPDEYDVIATPNLNGDYLSDAAAAQVGGLGMAPGANMGDQIALFEATHGTAPKYAGKDMINPCSLILSGVMMLEYLGWTEAAELILKAVEKTIQQKRVTYDLARQMKGATLLKCSEFGKAIIDNMESA